MQMMTYSVRNQSTLEFLHCCISKSEEKPNSRKDFFFSFVIENIHDSLTENLCIMSTDT